MLTFKAMINFRRIILTCLFLFIVSILWSQNSSQNWVKISDDEIAAIYYDSKTMITDEWGNHIIWVITDLHALEWQNYYTSEIGSRTPVVQTKTKAMYDSDYNYVMVRQVQLYNKSGSLLFDTGDDTSAGWGFVNASDPVGLVGEYLSKN